MINKKIFTIILLVLIIQVLSFSTSAIKNDTKYEKIINEEISQINITFNSSGYELYAEIYYPINESKTYPAVVFCEGLGGYIEAYNWIPKALAEKDYVTMVFDPPGQGISEGLLPIRSYSIPFLNLYVRSFSTFEAVVHYFSREWVKSTSDAIRVLDSICHSRSVSGNRGGVVWHAKLKQHTRIIKLTYSGVFLKVRIITSSANITINSQIVNKYTSLLY